MKSGIAVAALFLAGCTVGPDYHPAQLALPDQFAGKGPDAALQDAKLATWWSEFRDPKLGELVSRALAQNLDLEAAAARIREARASEVVAGAAAQPRIGATGSVARQRISEHAIPAPPGAGEQGGAFGLPGSEFTTWRPGFDASWEIDLFGRTRRSVEAARARTGAAIWNRRDIEVTTAAEVASAYFRLRTLQARIANAEAEVARQQRLEQLVAARARGGLVTGQDLAQRRSELSAAAAAIPALEAQMEVQIHVLGVLTSLTPDTLTVELSHPLALPVPPGVPAGIPSDLLRRRPDIRVAERDLAAFTADIGVAVADLYPRFSLTAAPALVSTALTTLLEWGSRSFTLGAAVDWPLFNGGRTRGNVAAANARQEQSLIAYRKAVLVALQDVEDSLSLIEGDGSQLARLEDAFGSAARAEEVARTRYSGGLVTYSDVLTAQARRISVESQVIEARGALARDTAALFKALGGGWPELRQEGSLP